MTRTQPPRGNAAAARFSTRIRRDFARLRAIKGRSLIAALIDALLFDSGFQALLAHRLAHALVRHRIPVLPAVLRRLSVASCGVDLLPRADIGGGCVISHGVGLVVGGTAVIGEDSTLLHGATLGEARFEEISCPRLGDRVTVGAGAILLGGIEVGDDATIGAGAVVLGDVPPGAVMAGVPARVVGWREGAPESGMVPFFDVDPEGGESDDSDPGSSGEGESDAEETGAEGTRFDA